MHENTRLNLVSSFEELSEQLEFTTSLKFIALDKTIFELKITSDNVQQMPQQILDIISTSVTAATTVIVSAK